MMLQQKNDLKLEEKVEELGLFDYREGNECGDLKSEGNVDEFVIVWLHRRHWMRLYVG